MSIAKTETPTMLALLHLAPRPGEVGHNKHLVEEAIGHISALGVKLIVTPELVVSGYGFRDMIGTDWIARGQKALFDWAGELAQRASASLLLGTPEAATADQALFNSVILFAPDGTRVGHHRKINALRIDLESWSSPGDRATVLEIDGVGRVGLSICADMYSERLVSETASRGVDLLISSAAWAPGLHGPDGEWERASLSTQRPVLVCNRTGTDIIDFSLARSIVAVDGAVMSSHSSPYSAVILVDWNPPSRQLANWRVIRWP